MTHDPRIDDLPANSACPPCRASGGSGGARRGAAFAALALVFLLAGCKGEKPRPAHEPGTVDMRLGTRSFRLYVAATEGARQYGLMNRDSLDADRGMIFVFPAEHEVAFYMKNTFIPLDILYVNAAGQVVSVQQMKPQERDPSTGNYRTFPSGAPAKYAIELNEGAAAAAGVKVGDVLEIPPGAREAQDPRYR